MPIPNRSFQNNGIKLLIVDDSATVRKVFVEMLRGYPSISDIVTAPDPIFALKKMQSFTPDVIITDIEMPNMDGLTFLQKVMETTPIPIIVCSSVAESSSKNALMALEYGAVEIINKPKLGVGGFLEESREEIYQSIMNAKSAKIRNIRKYSGGSAPQEPEKSEPRTTPRTEPPQRKINVTSSSKDPVKKVADNNDDGFNRANTADIMVPDITRAYIETTEKIILIGASTGGTEALKYVLSKMPADSPGIVIVQHMPGNFTKSFAQSLNSVSPMQVKEAQDGDLIRPGLAILAKGDFHCLVKRNGKNFVVEVKDGPRVSRHKPSVDVLFRSASKYVGPNAVAVIMTGMGNDGASGMLDLKKSGAKTIAQNEQTCVVYGMPKEAVKNGSVDLIVPLEEIPVTILKKSEYRGYR